MMDKSNLEEKHAVLRQTIERHQHELHDLVKREKELNEIEDLLLSILSKEDRNLDFLVADHWKSEKANHVIFESRYGLDTAKTEMRRDFDEKYDALAMERTSLQRKVDNLEYEISSLNGECEQSE